MPSPTPPVLIDSYTGEYIYKGRYITSYEDLIAAREDYERDLDAWENWEEARAEDREMERKFG